MTLNEFKKITKNMSFAEFKQYCKKNFDVLPPDPLAYNNSSYHDFLYDYESFERKLQLAWSKRKNG